MKKIIYILILLLVGFTAIAQETPPAGLKAVNAQFYIHLPDSTIWQQKGTPYNWHRVAKYSDLAGISSTFKLKADSVLNSGYVTHGYFNAHIPSYNFINGLTKDGSNNVSFGGTLTDYTNLSLNGYSIAMNDNSTGSSYVFAPNGFHLVSEDANPPFGNIGYLYGQIQGVNLGSRSPLHEAVLNIDVSNYGARYDDDLKRGIKYGWVDDTYLGDSSLVPKRFVTSAISALLSASSTFTGNNTFTNTTNFPNGRWDGQGPAADTYRRLTNTVNTQIFPSSDTSLINSLVIRPARDALSNTANYRSGKLKSMVSLRDSLIIADAKLMNYGSLSLDAFINNTSGNANNQFFGIVDRIVTNNVLNFAAFGSYRNFNQGYFINSLGSAQSTFAGTLQSKNKVISGDSLGYARLMAWGTSNTVAEGNANNTSDTSSYVYKTGKLKGMIGVSFGYSGRFTQKTTVGDSSLNDKIGKYVAPTTSRDVAILEGYPNDGKGDTLVYNTPIYQPQMTAVVNNLISIGWAADHIIILIPNYTNYNVLANHGNNYYRHSTYAAANAAIATATGCKVVDYWLTFPHNLLNSDSLHMTQAGHTWVAGRLTTDLTTFYGGATTYNKQRNITVGSAVVTNNLGVGGDVSINGQLTPHKLVLPNNLRVLNSFNGGPSLVFGGNQFVRDTTFIPNVNKTGTISTVTYGVKPDAYLKNTAIFGTYLNTNSANTIGIGGPGTSTLYSTNQITFYTTPLLNGTSSVAAATIDPNGQFTFTGNPAVSSAQARGVRLLPTLTPIANNNLLTPLYAGPTFATGTGALTATVTTNTTSLADGTYDNLTSTAITGAGTGQTWKLTVLGGVVTAAVPATSATGGIGYAVGNTLNVNTSTGTVITIASLGYSGITKVDAVFQDPISFANNTPTVKGVGMIYDAGTDLHFVNHSLLDINITAPALTRATGLLAVANGGTGTTTAPSADQVLMGVSGTAYIPRTITGDITPSAGVFTIGANKVTYAKMQAMTANRLLGSGASGTAVNEITLGTNLALTGNTLNATGGSGTVTSITPGYGHTSATPITTSGTMTIDTSLIRSAGNSYSLAGMQTKLKNYSVSRLKSFYTDVASTTSATDAYVYTVPANTLSTDGQIINAEYTANESGLTGTETILFYFAGIQIFNSGAIAPINGADKIKITIIRDSPTTFKSHVYLERDANLFVFQPSQHNSGALDPTITNDLKFNITSSTASIFTLTSGVITYLP